MEKVCKRKESIYILSGNIDTIFESSEKLYVK